MIDTAFLIGVAMVAAGTCLMIVVADYLGGE